MGGPDCYSRGNRRLETPTATIASFNGQGLTRMEYLNPHSISGRVNRVTWDPLAETLWGLFSPQGEGPHRIGNPGHRKQPSLGGI